MRLYLHLTVCKWNIGKFLGLSYTKQHKIKMTLDSIVKAEIASICFRKNVGKNGIGDFHCNCFLQYANIFYNASYLFQIFSEITHLSMCCCDRMSFWGMARHSHAHGQRELSCTAGVMLNIRRSDRNANQVSKLTLHSHRCTSDLQWFISQSESMCHCVEWLMGKHGSRQGAPLSSPHTPLPPPLSPSSMNSTLHEGCW